MVELVFVVCLLAQPLECQRVQPAFVGPMPVSSCRRNGMFYALQWLELHPRWKLQGWRCTPPQA